RQRFLIARPVGWTATSSWRRSPAATPWRETPGSTPVGLRAGAGRAPCPRRGHTRTRQTMSPVRRGSGASAAPGGGSMSREAERARGRALWDRWPWSFVWILAVPLLTVWPTGYYLDIHLSEHGPCIRTSALVACPAPLVV